MANPHIKWTQPDDDDDILRNDLVTISRKAPSSLKNTDGVDIGGTYFAEFNDVARSINPFVAASPSPGGGTNPAVPAHVVYVYTAEGKISLEGGAFELLPFSSGVSPATTVTFVDFAGVGVTGYPKSYNTLAGDPDFSNSIAGIPLCGVTTNVETQHTYSIAPMSVAPETAGSFGTGGINGSYSPGEGDNPATTSAATLVNSFNASFGDTTIGSPVALFQLKTGGGRAGPGHPISGTDPGFESAGITTNKVSEMYTVGGSFHNGTAVHDVHRGSVLFEVRPDTEAIISGGNVTQSKTGTASWAAGQGKTLTVTTSGAHGLTDQYNRVYITGASNNTINGLWNVATVTSDTEFTVKLFAAQCGPAAVTSSVNVVTYDGIDKRGGKLRQQTGTINTIQKVVTNVPASGSGPSATPATHHIDYRYTGSHGIGSSGTVTASVFGSGYSGTGGLPDGDFTGGVTIDSSSQFTRRVASSQSGASGPSTSTLASSLSANTFNADNDLEVVAGGMFGNTQVILKGSVSTTKDVPYSFHGNTTSSQVSTIYFTGASSERSLFREAGFKLNRDTGRVFTEGSPSTQPSGTDGMPGGFDPNTNPDGGVKEIDKWLPRSMHAKAKALERNDPTELLKANTSGQHQLDQMLNSPMVDTSDNLTTLLLPREQKEETCWFTMRAFKNPSHRRNNTFIEGEDVVTRQFGIKVYSNSSSDRNEIILDYIDQSNISEVANTDTSFVADGVAISNQQHLDNGYANGTFKNQ